MIHLYVALAVSFLLLLVSVQQGYFIAYPLLISWLVLLVLFRSQGCSWRSLLGMSLASSRTSVPVLLVLLLIGAVISVWMAAGTVPALVFYGLQSIHPRYFIVSAFGLTSLISMLLGTSFGTVGTIGIALMIMANSSGVHSHWAAGAIIAGAYFGDRGSPMSSSANLIATITQTDLYINLKNMAVTTLVPLGLASLFYGVLSWINPARLAQTDVLDNLQQTFEINPWVLIPVLIILVCSGLRVDVKISMLMSLGAGGAIAVMIQHQLVLDLVRYALLGFHPPLSSGLQSILAGGGLMSMVPVCLVVVISTAISGLLSGTHTFTSIERRLMKTRSDSHRFMATSVIGLLAATFGCSQTIAILFTQQLAQSAYQPGSDGNHQLALDLENTVVVIAPLIPWNIAGYLPATILATNAGFIPYAAYLYLIPVVTLVSLILRERKLALCN